MFVVFKHFLSSSSSSRQQRGVWYLASLDLDLDPGRGTRGRGYRAGTRRRAHRRSTGGVSRGGA